LFIQNFDLFRVQFIQDFDLFRVQFIQNFDLFRVQFRLVSLYNVSFKIKTFVFGVERCSVFTDLLLINEDFLHQVGAIMVVIVW
jgi:hypothetical protein